MYTVNVKKWMYCFEGKKEYIEGYIASWSTSTIKLKLGDTPRVAAGFFKQNFKVKFEIKKQ